MFTQADLEQIRAKRIELWKIEKQINFFRKGFPFINLIRPATINDGIVKLNDNERSLYIKLYEESLKELNIVKFVPASGAASRMFKHLFQFIEENPIQKDPCELNTHKHEPNSVCYLFTHLPEIAFYPFLAASVENDGSDITELISTNDYRTIAAYILTSRGLNYAFLPKALIGFHRYPEEIRTSAEEHIVEAANYARGHGNIARIHFTVSPEHRNSLEELFSRVVQKYEERFKVKIDILFSTQKSSTDTLAVDKSNNPFREQSGRLLFRPGGHGALLENLNKIEADMIFIKNIDNVVPDRLKESTFIYKKMIAGYLLSLRKRIFTFLNDSDNHRVTRDKIEEIKKFAEEKLYITFPENFREMDIQDQIGFLVSRLNRPIRVCGMVKNEGEPGGGPFWVSDNDNQQSLQIVESSQIDFTDDNQKKIFHGSTHFNPVDLVCSIKDYKGNTFDLAQFVDDNTGLISIKSNDGKELKAMELPGLWNGAMSDWITVFIEVPIITFNPVKTINDLLRKEHLTE